MYLFVFVCLCNPVHVCGYDEARRQLAKSWFLPPRSSWLVASIHTPWALLPALCFPSFASKYISILLKKKSLISGMFRLVLYNSLTFWKRLSLFLFYEQRAWGLTQGFHFLPCWESHSAPDTNGRPWHIWNLELHIVLDLMAWNSSVLLEHFLHLMYARDHTIFLV